MIVTRVAAPKGVVPVEDAAGGELPLWIRGDRGVATATCLVVTCAEGAATEITAGDLGGLPPPPGPIAFDGWLSTPTGTLAVRTILGATLLQLPASSPRPRELRRLLAESVRSVSQRPRRSG